jgi:hypothetical protein
MFQYCIWLLPKKNSPLYHLTNGFRPHISLAINLTLHEAKQLFETIDKKRINVKILKKNEINDSNGFFYYYHFVSKKKELPNKAHISFIYNLKPISCDDVERIYDSIDYSQNYTFDTYAIVCCKHKDYTKWYRILDYTINK